MYGLIILFLRWNNSCAVVFYNSIYLGCAPLVNENSDNKWGLQIAFCAVVTFGMLGLLAILIWMGRQ